MKNLKIGMRLAINTGMALFFLIVVGLYAINSVSNLHEGIDTLVEERMVNVEKANTIINQINIVARATRNMILDQSQQSRDNEKQRIAEARKVAGGALEHFSKNSQDPKTLAFIKKITTEIRPEFGKHLDAIIDLASKDQYVQAKEVLLGDYRKILYGFWIARKRSVRK